MNYKFLPFAIGMALASTAANAETFEDLTVEGATNLKGAVETHDDFKAWGETKLSTLDITIPFVQVDKSGKKERSYREFINCYDALTNAYNKMFTVSCDGYVGARSLGLSESPLDNSYCAKLHCGYNKEYDGWLFDTESYGGGPQNRFYSINFKAKGYTFDGGDMVVNGKITCKDELNVVALNAKDINVEMNNAADYVFDENYDLKSLSEVESYVNEHKHLPGIPSAADMAENGMSVAAMSNMLLEKVEELTLHMIRLEKENAALKAEVKSLKK